jgi:hypothetical protein
MVGKNIDHSSDKIGGKIGGTQLKISEGTK